MREIKSVLCKIGAKIPQDGERFSGEIKKVNYNVLLESLLTEADRVEMHNGKNTKIYKSKIG
jgi:hypothetical protein